MAAATPSTTPRPTKTLTSAGGGLGVLARAALPVVPGLNQLPGIRKTGGDPAGLAYERPPVRVERDAVRAYAEVCGFPAKDTVPLPYPHMLAFPLHMAIMSDPGFPYPAIGTVHLENSISSHRPIAVGEEVAVRTEVGSPRPHPKGKVLDFRTSAHVGDELVWESTSVYLRRGRGDDDAPFGTPFEEVPPTGTRWRLGGDLGRRYAAVSGDHNPIHLYPWTAKALGFQRQIAHGMWTKARCIAQLDNRLPDAVRVDVSFRKPVFLPGTVAFGSRAEHDGWAFSLTSPRNGAVHLLGRTHAL